MRRVGLRQGARSSVVPADPSRTGYSPRDASVTGASTDGSGDFRNAPNTFGWAVESGPCDPLSTPRKRSALGCFAHGGAWPGRPQAGRPLDFYMGDDSRGEYVYKFVSAGAWNPADASGSLAAGDRYLDAGTLCAARFDAEGTGTWVKLDLSDPDVAGRAAHVSDLADVVTNFEDAHYRKNVTLSALGDRSDQSKPDGCWFSPAGGILWTGTDDNTYTDVGNCMLLAALPGTVGNGGTVTVENLLSGSPDPLVVTPTPVTTRMGAWPGEPRLRRFLTAPKGAEVTGLAETPDGRVPFVNIQQPGENTGSATAAPGSSLASGMFESHWPGNGRGLAAPYGPGGARPAALGDGDDHEGRRRRDGAPNVAPATGRAPGRPACRS